MGVFTARNRAFTFALSATLALGCGSGELEKPVEIGPGTGGSGSNSGIAEAGSNASAAGAAAVGAGSNATGAAGTSAENSGNPASAGTSGDNPGHAGASGENGTGGASMTPASEVALRQQLEGLLTLDGAGLLASHALRLEDELTYDPASAEGLELLQGSSLALTESEHAKLVEHGFVISKTKKFPSFAYGYKTIYADDLPLYVSADSILNAVHHSFDNLLKALETLVLTQELQQFLQGMRARLPSATFDAKLKADLDLYLTLAESLLEGTPLTAEAGADPAKLTQVYELAVAASGHTTVEWFGTSRDEDFSQFKPRGHYTDSPELARYFRAMMLLGRVDLRLVETEGDGSQRFHRDHFDAAVAFRELATPELRANWAKIDEIVGAFVGERDAMSFEELDALLGALGVSDFAASKALEDTRIVQELERGGFGAQRIASRIIMKGTPGGATLPLDRSFALFGQRYTVDSHVFVNTSYDRVLEAPYRLMPDPLDAAFAAFGNDAALELLKPELDHKGYVQGLAKSRLLVDAHESTYWEGSLYTTWLSALRTLSPTESSLAELPSVARTRAFQTRVLNTQLASWAELRRDTILYAKQSYSAGTTCEFPDAYVDPYPEFYARLRRFAERISEFTAALPDAELPEDLLALTPESIELRTAAYASRALDKWVANFIEAMNHLEQMAKDQQTGTPHGQAALDFINQAVTWETHFGCGGPPMHSALSGWYLGLFFEPSEQAEVSPEPKFLEFDPTIADVHTQPTDEGGADVGRVLHVGTGHARLMVVTVDTCNGPRAYVGLASSYAETIEENWKRLNDQEWSARIDTGVFPDVPWMTPLLAE